MASTALHRLNPFDAAIREHTDIPISTSPRINAVPDNTPQSATPNVNRTTKTMDMTALAQHLAQAEQIQPGQFWENDSAVPHNTPAPAVQSPVVSASHGYSADEIRDRLHNLPPNYFHEHGFTSPPSNASSHRLGHEFPASPSRSIGSAPRQSKMIDFYHESPQPVVPLLAPHFSAGAPQLAQTPFTSTSSVASSAGTRAPLESPTRPQRSPAGPILHSEGVPEHSDWGEDVEEDVRKALAKLYNLARDDWQKDPTVAVTDHFKMRLMRIATSNSPFYGSFASTLVGLIQLPGEDLVDSMKEQVDGMAQTTWPYIWRRADGL